MKTAKISLFTCEKVVFYGLSDTKVQKMTPQKNYNSGIKLPKIMSVVTLIPETKNEILRHIKLEKLFQFFLQISPKFMINFSIQ